MIHRLNKVKTNQAYERLLILLMKFITTIIIFLFVFEHELLAKKSALHLMKRFKLGYFQNLKLLFVQSVNIPATKQFIKTIVKPQLFLPQQSLNSINSIDVDELKNAGIKYIVFDKDQTLTSTYSNVFHPTVSIAIFKKSFGDNYLAILSNSVGSNDDKDYQGFIICETLQYDLFMLLYYVRIFKGAILTETSLHLNVIRHKHKKPDCLNEVCCFMFLFNEIRKYSHLSEYILLLFSMIYLLLLVYITQGNDSFQGKDN